MTRSLALAAALAAASAAGCIYSPEGRCDSTADCGAGETCDEGVCVRAPSYGGNGSGGGTDPTTFTPVLWSTLQAAAGATFSVDAVGADAATGDLVVAGALEGPFDPWALSTGGFVARLDGAGGAPRWEIPFPTFSHGRLRTAMTASGHVLFAGTALDTTDVGTGPLVPGAGGALILGRLDAAGVPMWAKAVDGTGAAIIAPASLAAQGDDLLVAGTGAANFGCGSTGGATFVALLSGADGGCVWSRGLATSTVTKAEPRPAGDVALGGLCTPSGASFDPGGGATCTKGLFVAVLSGTDGSTSWARSTSGSGTVTAVRDLSVAPSGAIAIVGGARGAVSFGGAVTDFGASEGSFLATYGAAGAAGLLLRPVEAPTAPLRDAASFDRCAYDRNGKLWLAGRYYGQPTVGGVRFTPCRGACLAASWLGRVEPNGTIGSFLPIRIAGVGGDAAFADDHVLFATTGTIAHALRFTGASTAPAWTGRAGLGVLRMVP